MAAAAAGAARFYIDFYLRRFFNDFCSRLLMYFSLNLYSVLL